MLFGALEDTMKIMPTEPAAIAELERIEAALKAARARRAQFFRDLSGRTRRAETERLCVLGRAIARLCEDDAAVLADFRSFLRDYISRDSDRLALAGTAFDVSAPEQDHRGGELELTDHHDETDY